MTRTILSLTSTALFAFAPLMAAPKANLQSLENSVADVATQADYLQTLAREPIANYEAHAVQLNQIKNELNQVGRQLQVLESERASLPNWETQALDKAVPQLKIAASSTEAAIQYFNAHPRRLWTPTYRDYTRQVAVDAQQAAHTLREYLKYAKAHQTEADLQKTLGMTDN